MTKWIDCLKEYNRNKRVWCVARKGTRTYNKIMQCVNGKKNSFVKKKKMKIVEKFEDEKPRDIQDNPDIVAQMKRVSINDVPQDVMNNIMGSYLGVADKANLANIGVKIKVTITDEEKRVKLLRTLIKKLNQSKNNLDKIFEDLPTAEKYQSAINKYRSKIYNLVKLLIKKTFDDKHDVFMVSRDSYGFDFNYILIILPNFNEDKAEELNTRRITLDNLKPYLKIKNLTPEENDLLTKTLNTEKPDLSEEDRKLLKKEKKAIDDAGNEEKNRRNILTKLTDLRWNMIREQDENKYDEFLEINKILRSLTPISFKKFISIIGPKQINHIAYKNDYPGKQKRHIWQIKYDDGKKKEDNIWIIRDEINITKKIPTKLQNMIDKYI